MDACRENRGGWGYGGGGGGGGDWGVAGTCIIKGWCGGYKIKTS